VLGRDCSGGSCWGPCDGTCTCSIQSQITC
jgi:hypothetical protein